MCVYVVCVLVYEFVCMRVLHGRTSQIGRWGVLKFLPLDADKSCSTYRRPGWASQRNFVLKPPSF